MCLMWKWKTVRNSGRTVQYRPEKTTWFPPKVTVFLSEGYYVKEGFKKIQKIIFREALYTLFQKEGIFFA